MINKRDLIRSRTPTDTEYRYQLNKIAEKVDKVTGKGLSTNDFTDTYKKALDDINRDKHHHNNLSVLNQITEVMINDWNNKANEKNLYILFQGSSNSDVTLLDNKENYDFIAILYGTAEEKETKFLLLNDGKEKIVLNSIKYLLEDNILTKETTDTTIYIYKVVGFKFEKGVIEVGSD